MLPAAALLRHQPAGRQAQAASHRWRRVSTAGALDATLEPKLAALQRGRLDDSLKDARQKLRLLRS